MSEPDARPNALSITDFAAILLGGVALLYLINPTAGFLELIPDNLPIVGNLDEAAATAILLGVLRHFGFDLTGGMLGDRAPAKAPQTKSPFADEATEAPKSAEE